VVEPRRDITVDLYFKARSTWASNVCDFNIHSITLEEVPSDFGTPVYIGSPAAATEVANFSPVGAPSQPGERGEEAETSDVTATAPSVSTDPVAGLLDVMTDDDLTVIINGLRAVANLEQFGQAISDGFERFAVVLEKYQAQKFG
jgi:hypothetical protein